MRNLLLPLLLLSACVDGRPSLPTGTTYDGSPTEPDAGAPTVLVWVDAKGQQVTSSPDLHWTTPEGLVLYLDAETGQAAALLEDVHYLAGYESAGCAGPLLIGAHIQPRVPFGLGDGKGWRVRPDTAASRLANVVSRPSHDGGCMALGQAQQSLVFEAPEPSLATLPETPFTGPLHLEERPWPTR